ncbi:hypothetical protein K470DRAFT_255408 [Piedraia hortae CBS 480.64]|uniref:Pentatricopeptide repeat protein n=1 Tax=Piedraia hortae CBS 480.64 TaxID=1314780 RepID=A0A6A7C615_9PEZI|nr:hypothetical protein K470DRAFT_255408 [Piedraia hortae CBS 480.64]
MNSRYIYPRARVSLSHRTVVAPVNKRNNHAQVQSKSDRLKPQDVLNQIDSHIPRQAPKIEYVPQLGHAKRPRPGFDSLKTSAGIIRSSGSVKDTSVASFILKYGKRMIHAIESQNINLAERIKIEVMEYSLRSDAPNLPNDVYEHLMLTLLTLRKPASAMEVWHHFTKKLGKTPTVKTYTVMMRGSQHVRDVNAMEAFWRRMRSSGIQPDSNAWSVRIFGLIKANQVEVGLQALADMGQEWLAVADSEQTEDNVKGIPRPSTIIMNSAISALGARGEKYLPGVFAWGRQFGLEADIVTYNCLLNLSLRHGRQEEAVGILERMKERSILANSTTWLILFTALFESRSLEGLSHEDQLSQVMSFIHTLESQQQGSTAIDTKGYALVIDRLLKFYSNTLAANAVLTHMLKRGIKPSTHIFTILLTFYFQSSPPDFASAEQLWKYIRNTNAGVDSMFYDRMIEAYAAHHLTTGTQPIVRFLRQMRKEGKRPSWRALETATRALVECGQWEEVNQIVKGAREWIREGGDDGEMLLRPRQFGKRAFWEYVISTGVMDEEAIREVDNLVGVGEDVRERKRTAGPVEKKL